MDFSAWIKNGGPSAYNCVLRRALRTRSTITTLGHISSAAGKLRLKSETLPDLQGWRSRIHTYQTRQILSHCLRFDSANATSNDRMIIYINGSRATLSTNLMPASSLQAAVNSTYQHQIGCFVFYDSSTAPSTAITGYFNGLMNKVCFVEGLR